VRGSVKAWLALIAAGLMLSGCVGLPRGGPLAMEVTHAARNDNSANFLLIDVNSRVADYLRTRPQPVLSDKFGRGKPVRADRIGVGDQLQVMIWEADPGGLFASNGIVNRGAIPTMTVDASGFIEIPYAGAIRAAGRTPRQVADAITRNLSKKTVEPQASVSWVKNVSSTVTLTGEVSRPGIYPLSIRGDDLLDLIAAAGGSKFPGYESLISLTRHGKIAKAYLSHVVGTPQDNIYLQPGDELHVERRPKTFTAFGAVQKEGMHDFRAAKLSILEAVARTSGLTDARANPTGVFVMRFEPAKVAYALAGQTNPMDSRTIVPVIYRFDLQDPNQYFFAQVIGLHDRDIIYVANAPSVELNKFLGLLARGMAAARGSINFSEQF